MRSTRDARAPLGAKLQVQYREEPLLRFAGNREWPDQKEGIARFGPASLGLPRHPDRIRIGFIGSGSSIESARRWITRTSPGVEGVQSQRLPDFPGLMADRGFFCEAVADDDLSETITAHDLRKLEKIRKRADRFEDTVNLIDDRFKLLRQRDDPPDLVLLALPDDLNSVMRINYRDPELGTVYRDLRRTLKARLMSHDIPTQILLPRTSEAKPGARNVDHASRVAWNLYTGMFFKAGGVPWSPVTLRPDTCYVGLSFHRPLGSSASTLRSSVAQAFDEHGTGLILRGPDFPWNSVKYGPSPHLDAERAKELLALVLGRYKAETRRTPRRVVIHKTSRFWQAEQDGFADALADVAEYDLVAVAPTSAVRLVRSGNYPPLRGTIFSIGDLSYLYTTGYIPVLKAYPHGHVPAPLQIADHHGDSPMEVIADEILALTKMNWNSTVFAGAMPITLRFSRLVGDIMREVPSDQEPQPAFKFYT